MSLTNPYAQYRQTSIETATQTRMIVMLHDGAIRFLQQGLEAMKVKDAYQQCVAMNKAVAIIDHLHSSINVKEGGEIAACLARLFPYFHERAVYANVKDDQAATLEVIGHLRNLRDAWAAVEEMKKEATASAADSERGELSMAA